MRLARPQCPDGSAAIARRFGVSVKALRLYEKVGLLKPARDEHGWRSYGRAACERLAQIVALRELGLSLANIAELIGGGQTLGAVLAAQERSLVEQQARTEAALAIVRRVSERVGAGEALDPSALAELLRRTKATRLRWTPELTSLAETIFDEHQRRRLGARAPDIDVRWAEIYDELARLAPGGDPRSPEARSLGERSVALIERMTGGDSSTWRAMERFWRSGLASPATAEALPMTQSQWLFLYEVIHQLRHEMEAN
jgi:DNA-binding transcriptional MerR regulator